MTKMTEIFGEPIHTYSRAEAISDGVLVAANHERTRANLIRFPVAYTAAVFADFIRDFEDTIGPPDETSREEDVLIGVAVALRRAKQEGRQGSSQTFGFQRKSPEQDNPEMVTLKVVVGPGDEGEPVLTVMFDHED